MGILVVFKDVSGDQLMVLSNPDTPEKLRMLTDAPKFQIGNVLRITDPADSKRQARWQIVGIERNFANSEVFGQQEPIMKYEFTMQCLD
ncbi:MAG: hypothetical protein Q7R57_10360 [Dehalococcoidales bacterium]|nr:hypothetical protein [Dehalococcoidales bacterium]